MSVEVLLSLFLPIVFGALTICLWLPAKPVYQIATSRASGALRIALVVAPIFAYGLYFVALRPLDAGNDTARYVATYSNLDGPIDAVATGARYFGNTEFLWWPFQSLFRPTLDAQNWLIANFVLVFVSTWVFYKSAARALGLSSTIFALAFLTFFLVYSGNIMRQALAAPLGALGFFLYFGGRRKTALLLMFVAIGLHWSSIAFLAAPLFGIKAIDRHKIYLAAPLGALAISTFASQIIGDIVSLAGFSALTDKFNLYFSGVHESHVGEVWKTANFWICSIISLLFLLFVKPERLKTASLHRYTCLFLSLILFGINTADFAERYMPLLLLVSPMQAALLIERIKAPPVLKGAAYFGSFITLSALVLMATSSQHTLGYAL